MDCILIGEVGTPLLGVSTGDKYIGMDSLLTTKTDLLRNIPDICFILNDGVLDLTVKDNDELWAVPKLAQVYKAFKTLYKNGELTNIIPSELDKNTSAEFKKSVGTFVSGSFGKQTGITLEQLNRMFVDRITFEMSNTDSGYFAVRRNILTMDNILKNTEDAVKKYIQQFLSENEEVFENLKMLSDEQEVFFYSTSNGVMPTYEEVADIITDDLDEYRFKSIVPKYHNYVGPFVNYQKGAIGSTGSYVDGEYIHRALVAEVMNDRNYRTTIATRRSELATQKIGDKVMSITPTVITGDAEYDADPIQANERSYYEELCKWEDMCLTRDILEAPVEEWVKLGLDIKKYMPLLPVTSRVKPFSEINSETYEMTSDKSKTFTMDKLAQFELTEEVFRSLHSGSPTSNKWFKYALNIALLSTRYYTGGIEAPIGYDVWDFDKSKVADVSFDDKYTLYMSGKVRVGNRIYSAEDVDNLASDVTFDDYGDIYSERGAEYWFNISEDDAEGKQDSGNDNSVKTKDLNLLEEVMLYCLNSGVEHALPEALIKCLRFDKNKPRSLQLDSLTSRVDLTTGAQVTDVDYSSPVEYEDGKPSIISSFVTVDTIDESVKAFLKECTNVKSFGKAVIGVGVTTRYKQPDGTVVNVVEYYDIQTLVNDEILQEQIVNLVDGKVIESNPKSETVAEVIQKVSRNVTTMSIQMNDAVMISMITGYQDKLKPELPAYKIIANINKSGFNMFTFANSLANLKELTKNIKYIRMGKVVDKLSATRSTDEVTQLLNAEMLTRYGNIIVKSTQITASGNEAFSQTYKLWQTESDYSLSLNSISSEANSVDAVGEYRKKVVAFLGKTAQDAGKSADSKWGLLAIKMSKESSTPTFYAMQNKEIINKIIVMSAKNITRDALTAYVSNADKVISQPMSKLIAMVKAMREKAGGSYPVQTIINKIFDFVDDETKETFTTIIVNNMKG